MTSAGAERLPDAGTMPQIFGRYLLVSRLSRGGMGEIFLARHGISGFEKLVVIKKVLPQLSADQEFSRRFINEAQVAVKLQHANIAQVYEVGRVGEEYFLAMEYIEGRDLRRTLAVLAESKRSLPPDLALFIARDVTNGLAYAHRRTGADGESLELVHCDISPPNIVMSFEGETKIIDFGIAKSALRSGATDAKRGFGKFGYMSPEQLIRGRKVDHRTDIYAAGVILYEMLTGQRLYDVGDSPDYRALARMVSKGQHPLPSQTDPKLSRYDELVARALKPDPADRYPSAAAFRDAIQQALVEVNPAFSPDQLGAFMRYVFADEVLEQRQRIEALDGANLEQFKGELSAGASSTVSFALSTASSFQGVEPSTVAPLPEPPPRAGTQAETQVISRPIDAPARPASRRTFGVVVAFIAVAAAGIAVAMKVRGDDPPPPAPPQQPAAPVVTQLPPDPPPPREPTPTVTPDASVPVASALPEPSDAGAREEPRKSQRPPRRDRRASEKTPPLAPELSAAEVQSRFRAVKREYTQFKKKYGARLEAEWNDLASLATFGQGPQKLEAIDREIARFRAKMRAARGE